MRVSELPGGAGQEMGRFVCGQLAQCLASGSQPLAGGIIIIHSDTGDCSAPATLPRQYERNLEGWPSVSGGLDRIH